MLAAIVCWGLWGLMVTSCSQNEEADDLIQGPTIQTANVENWQMSNKVTFKKSGSGHIIKFSALMPLPQSNIYQTVENLNYIEGKVLTDKNYGNKALYVDRDEFVSTEYIMETTFDIHTKKMVVDVSKINSIQPYDPKSEPCKLYLGDRGEYIVTSNPYIVKTGDMLWAESEDVIDYARRCYEYVASNFKYIKGPWRTLEQILKDGGGECGDFSTLVVNLLRYKGIPSRHNICVTVGGGYHVWVDFYLEGYGWVPLDATYKNGNPKGDFFGKYDGECIILMQDFCYDFGYDSENDLNVDILQDFYYWYSSDNEDCKINAAHKVSRLKKLVNEQ